MTTTAIAAPMPETRPAPRRAEQASPGGDGFARELAAVPAERDTAPKAAPRDTKRADRDAPSASRRDADEAPDARRTDKRTQDAGQATPADETRGAGKPQKDAKAKDGDAAADEKAAEAADLDDAAEAKAAEAAEARLAPQPPAPVADPAAVLAAAAAPAPAAAQAAPGVPAEQASDVAKAVTAVSQPAGGAAARAAEAARVLLAGAATQALAQAEGDAEASGDGTATKTEDSGEAIATADAGETPPAATKAGPNATKPVPELPAAAAAAPPLKQDPAVATRGEATDGRVGATKDEGRKVGLEPVEGGKAAEAAARTETAPPQDGVKLNVTMLPPLPPGAAAPQALDGTAAQAAAPAAPQAQTPPTPVSMLPIEIGLRAMEGQQRFEIRLSPENLGRVDVRLDIADDGGVKAHIVVDRVDTLNLLQRDARTLERAFEQAGLRTGDGALQFSLGNQGQGAQSQDGERRPTFAGPDRTVTADADAATREIAASLRAYGLSAGGLDIRI
ncbi:flagellar hook-length control protein FliK [Alsobacter sp. R-9]